MNHTIPDGVWPTMLTPFTEMNEIDESGLAALVEWYIGKGVDGLFAVCQSSEMFYLSLSERVKLARLVVEQAKGRVPVIASGHVSESLSAQVEEIRRIADTGVRNVVLITNRLARPDEDEDVWKRRAETILSGVPDSAFGLYECPYPYKRLLSPELLQWCAETGRFHFLKDTSCDLAQLQAKQEAVRHTGLKLFNANSATLLPSLQAGLSGFSGVMANFHPDLYVWLTRHWQDRPDEAGQVQEVLSVASLIEHVHYPVSAKFHLQQLEGLPITLCSRAKSGPLESHQQAVALHLHRLVERVRQIFGIES